MKPVAKTVLVIAVITWCLEGKTAGLTEQDVPASLAEPIPLDCRIEGVGPTRQALPQPDRRSGISCRAMRP
jgi:hypothetical protein